MAAKQIVILLFVFLLCMEVVLAFPQLLQNGRYGNVLQKNLHHPHLRYRRGMGYRTKCVLVLKRYFTLGLMGCTGVWTLLSQLAIFGSLTYSCVGRDWYSYTIAGATTTVTEGLWQRCSTPRDNPSNTTCLHLSGSDLPTLVNAVRVFLLVSIVSSIVSIIGGLRTLCIEDFLEEEDKSCCHYLTMVSYFTTIVFSGIACSVFTWYISKEEESEYGGSMHIGWVGAGAALLFVFVKLETWCDAGHVFSRRQRKDYEAV